MTTSGIQCGSCGEYGPACECCDTCGRQDCDCVLPTPEPNTHRMTQRQLIDLCDQLRRERDALLGALRNFVEHYSGARRAQLGNGFAYRWYDEAGAAIALAEGGGK